MFILKSQATIEKAIERAKQVRPRITVKTFGEYSVSGASGNTYTVRCERRDGLKTVDCDCVAGQYGTPCHHAAAAIGLHIVMAQAAL
jgi:hypothetical protein